jgi:hypothetical protein
MHLIKVNLHPEKYPTREYYPFQDLQDVYDGSQKVLVTELKRGDNRRQTSRCNTVENRFIQTRDRRKENE